MLIMGCLSVTGIFLFLTLIRFSSNFENIMSLFLDAVQHFGSNFQTRPRLNFYSLN